MLINLIVQLLIGYFVGLGILFASVLALNATLSKPIEIEKIEEEDERLRRILRISLDEDFSPRTNLNLDTQERTNIFIDDVENQEKKLKP